MLGSAPALLPTAASLPSDATCAARRVAAPPAVSASASASPSERARAGTSPQPVPHPTSLSRSRSEEAATLAHAGGRAHSNGAAQGAATPPARRPPRPPERRLPPFAFACAGRAEEEGSGSVPASSADGRDEGGEEEGEEAEGEAADGSPVGSASLLEHCGLRALAGAMRAGALPERAAALRHMAADAEAAELIAGGAAMRAPLGMVFVERAELPICAADFWRLFVADGCGFLGSYRQATGALELSLGAWRPFAAGGRVREVKFVQVLSFSIPFLIFLLFLPFLCVALLL